MMVGMKMYRGSAGGINVLQNVYEDYDTGTLVETHEFLAAPSGSPTSAHPSRGS